MSMKQEHEEHAMKAWRERKAREWEAQARRAYADGSDRLAQTALDTADGYRRGDFDPPECQDQYPHNPRLNPAGRVGL